MKERLRKPDGEHLTTKKRTRRHRNYVGKILERHMKQVRWSIISNQPPPPPDWWWCPVSGETSRVFEGWVPSPAGRAAPLARGFDPTSVLGPSPSKDT